MPGWLRTAVEANPVSWMTTALRGLMGGGATLGQVALALLFPLVLTLVLAPVTLRLYARK
jgi:ABC-2 type transport system permease protein